MSDACLTIRTGLQGSGKTLNAIKELDAISFKEQRPVYYHNVTDLDPSKLRGAWFKFDDPYRWYELPNDSLIVIDEAQTWFGVRDPRQSVPPHLSFLEIMRKKGHELHLITQDPRFLDVHARRLCNCHIHFWRIFGSSQVTRYQMPRVHESVEKLSSFKDADRKIIKLDKKFFSVYSSAQAQHHFKLKMPRKAIIMIAALFASLYAIYNGYNAVYGSRDSSSDSVSAPGAGSSSPAQTVVDAVSSVVPGASSMISSGEKKRPLTREEYLAQRVPRVPGYPASAPIYDDIAKPVTYPKLSCVMSEDPRLLDRPNTRFQVRRLSADRVVGCGCLTQQGTRYEVPFGVCLNMVQNGYFDPARPDPQSVAFSQGGSRPGQRGFGVVNAASSVDAYAYPTGSVAESRQRLSQARTDAPPAAEFVPIYASTPRPRELLVVGTRPSSAQ